jgi:hypothetical protein
MHRISCGHPQSVLEGEFDHRELYPGDNGIRFEPSEEALETIGDIERFQPVEEIPAAKSA